MGGKKNPAIADETKKPGAESAGADTVNDTNSVEPITAGNETKEAAPAIEPETSEATEVAPEKTEPIIGDKSAEEVAADKEAEKATSDMPPATSTEKLTVAQHADEIMSDPELLAEFKAVMAEIAAREEAAKPKPDPLRLSIEEYNEAVSRHGKDFVTATKGGITRRFGRKLWNNMHKGKGGTRNGWMEITPIMPEELK